METSLSEVEAQLESLLQALDGTNDAGSCAAERREASERTLSRAIGEFHESGLAGVPVELPVSLQTNATDRSAWTSEHAAVKAALRDPLAEEEHLRAAFRYSSMAQLSEVIAQSQERARDRRRAAAAAAPLQWEEEWDEDREADRDKSPLTVWNVQNPVQLGDDAAAAPPPLVKEEIPPEGALESKERDNTDG